MALRGQASLFRARDGPTCLGSLAVAKRAMGLLKPALPGAVVSGRLSGWSSLSSGVMGGRPGGSPAPPGRLGRGEVEQHGRVQAAASSQRADGSRSRPLVAALQPARRSHMGG
eukprot:10496235-Lingulodinium_polyedra.AAC.1